MTAILACLKKKEALLKENILLCHTVSSKGTVSHATYKEIKDSIQRMHQLNDAIKSQDILFLKAYDTLLMAHEVEAVSKLPVHILKEFKPIQSQIQLIQDLESILKDELTHLSTLEQQLKKYEQYKNISKAYGHK